MHVKMETKLIFVTGGAGFIGRNICLELQGQGNEVIALDNFSSGIKENLQKFKGRIIQADIRNFKWGKEKENPDAIIHEAAVTDTTIQDKEEMFSANFNPFKKMIKYALKKGINLIYASSAAIYGRGTSPMKESQKEDILSPYAESKWRMDNLAKSNFKAFEKDGLNLIGLRYFNVYGPREKHKKKMASMILQIYQQMKAGKRPRIFQYGEQKRDQVYVKDVVKATLLALSSKRNGIYNIGSGKPTTFNEIVQELNKNLDTNLKPEYIKNPYKHYQNETLADLSNAKKFLGYEPTWNIEEGIKDYVKNLEAKNE